TKGVHVSRVPRLVHGSLDLHVFLRHRLVRQPQGFESLRPVRVSLATDYPPVPDREEKGGGELGLLPAASPPSEVAAERQHSVSAINDPPESQPVAGPWRQPVEPDANALTSPISAVAGVDEPSS